MECPNCKSPALAEQKFCRSCGANLNLVTQPLAETVEPSDLQMRSAMISPREVSRTDGSPHWALLIMLVGVAIGAIGKKLMHEDLVTVIGILIALAGIFFTAYPYLSLSRYAKESARQSPPTEVPTSQAPKHLPEERTIESVPSVTERTTELLKQSGDE